MTTDVIQEDAKEVLLDKRLEKTDEVMEKILKIGQEVRAHIIVRNTGDATKVGILRKLEDDDERTIEEVVCELREALKRHELYPREILKEGGAVFIKYEDMDVLKIKRAADMIGVSLGVVKVDDLLKITMTEVGRDAGVLDREGTMATEENLKRILGELGMTVVVVH